MNMRSNKSPFKSPFGRNKSALKGISLFRMSLFGMIGTFAIDFLLNLLRIPFSIFQTFYFDPGRITVLGEVWRLPAFPFLGAAGSDFYSLIWFAFSMLIYQVVINTLEARVGRSRANLFMILSWATLAGYGFLAGVYVDFYPVILGITALAGLYNPNFTIYFYFFIPIRGLVLGLLGFGLMIWNGINGAYQYFLIIALLLLLNHEAVMAFISGRKRQTQYAQKIKKATAPVKAARHRCEVCGRTEKDVPDMLFRYCSQCDGSFEYCEDHINDHEHRSNVISMERKSGGEQ